MINYLFRRYFCADRFCLFWLHKLLQTHTQYSTSRKLFYDRMVCIFFFGSMFYDDGEQQRQPARRGIERSRKNQSRRPGRRLADAKCRFCSTWLALSSLRTILLRGSYVADKRENTKTLFRKRSVNKILNSNELQQSKGDCKDQLALAS